MTKEAALQAFYERFLPAYQENAVPTGANKPAYPYITYEMATDSWGTPVALSASLWYRTTSWLAPNAMSRSIERAIGRTGLYLPCDGGAVYISRGKPFSRSGSDADDTIKRKILTIMVEYLTED